MSLATPCLRPLSILIVDDHIDTACSLARLLQLLGFETRVAFDGAGALRVVADSPPDVALLDLWLPDMDGPELAARLCQEMGHRPLLVAVTGCGGEQDRERTRQAGFDHHLVKPFILEELEAILHRHADSLAAGAGRQRAQ